MSKYENNAYTEFAVPEAPGKSEVRTRVCRNSVLRM